MALDVGINATGDNDCTASITPKTTFDYAQKVYFDVLYRAYACGIVPQSPLIVSYWDGSAWKEIFRLNSCQCYGYVIWKNAYITDGGGYNFLAEYGGNKVYFYIKSQCVPAWKCEKPLNGYENDGCGNRKLNSACDPPPNCIPAWKCEIPLNGYENDGCGNRRLNSACNSCVPAWKCETPLNGYENDGCGNRRLNSACNSCTPDWKCETPLNGYENDGCGNRRLNSACNSCVPAWKCETPLNGYENDGCGNRRLNSACGSSSENNNMLILIFIIIIAFILIFGGHK